MVEALEGQALVKMIDNAEAAIAVLRDRILAEEHKACETAPIVTMMRVNTSGAGPSGVIKKKKM